MIAWRPAPAWLRYRVAQIGGGAGLALLLAACGGGGSAGPGQPGLPAAHTAGGSAQATIALTIPARSASGAVRSPAYISAGTESMTVSTIGGNGAPTQIAEADLTPASPGCASAAGGATQCSITFGAAPGTSTFLVDCYDAVGGKGNLLSSATFQATLVAGTTNVLPVVLDGVAATATVILGASSLPVGAAGTTTVAVEASDAAGNVIVGPGSFTAPINVTVGGDPWGTLAPAAFTFTAPGQVKALNYSGNSLTGATLTPSAGGVTGTPATFAGSGLVVNAFQPNPAPGTANYFYPKDVAAFANGTAAMLFAADLCCQPNAYTIGIVNPTALLGMYAGDTNDPFNPPAPGSVTIPGATVINGMNENLQTEPGQGYSTLAAGPNGLVYYIAYYTSNADPQCPGGTSQTGLIGALNTGARSVHETKLKGYPLEVRTDAAGNVWFVEYAGQCSTTGSLLGAAAGYQFAVGEITSGGAVSEVPFSALGIASNAVPADMAITPDGSSMFIADNGNNAIVDVSTTGRTSSTVALTLGTNPLAIAVAPDGTVAWFTHQRANNYYYWGYVRGSLPFSSANVAEPLFIASGFFSYAVTYADGSFWLAGHPSNTGIGRLANLAAGTPLQSYVQLPDATANPAQVAGIAAAGGYVWGADEESGSVISLQYGAASQGAVIPAARYRSASAEPHGAVLRATDRIRIQPPPHGPLQF